MLAALLLLAATTVAPPQSKMSAPETIPHTTALFLASLSNDGKQKVTFRAQAVGTRYFFEESGGVSVYEFDGTQYRRDKFLKGVTLAQAIKKVTGHR